MMRNRMMNPQKSSRPTTSTESCQQINERLAAAASSAAVAASIPIGSSAGGLVFVGEGDGGELRSR
jgi:hypothetical protein